MVSSAYKKLFLRGLAWDANIGKEEAVVSLQEALIAAARAQLVTTKTGQILQSTAGNNHSVTFALPAAGRGASPQDIAELSNELIELYDTARTSLIDNESVAAPTDAQILAEMLLRLEPVRESYADFGSLTLVGNRCR